MEKLKNKPSLRFPEFDRKWENSKLGDITYKVDKKNKTKELLPIYSINNYNGFTPQSEQFEGLDSNERGYDISLYKIIENNTFAYNPARINVGSIGYSGNLDRLIVSSLYVCFKTKENINDDFFYKFVKTDRFINYVNKMGEGGVRIYLFYENFSLIPFSFPTLAEQTKITSFLTAVDDKLDALKHKKTLLEQYKKGVMQKIFSQELRFKDDNGNEYPDWEEKKLGDIGEIVTGKTPSTANLDLWDGEILFVTPTDIKQSKYQISTERTIKKTEKLKILPCNSIMFTCIASIGKMSISIYPSVTNQQINTLIPNESYYHEFIYYGLLNITDFIKSTPSSSTLPLINKTEFSRFIIQIPCIEEQTKIANFLSAIDDKINHCQSQIEKTEVWKKGLLQQMFL